MHSYNKYCLHWYNCCFVNHITVYSIAIGHRYLVRSCKYLYMAIGQWLMIAIGHSMRLAIVVIWYACTAHYAYVLGYNMHAYYASRAMIIVVYVTVCVRVYIYIAFTGGCSIRTEWYSYIIISLVCPAVQNTNRANIETTRNSIGYIIIPFKVFLLVLSSTHIASYVHLHVAIVDKLISCFWALLTRQNDSSVSPGQ